MDVVRALDVAAPVVAVAGLLGFTYGLGKLVVTPVDRDSHGRTQDGKSSMFLFWILFFASNLQHDPCPKWLRLVVLIAALLYLAAAFSPRFRRALFHQRGAETNAA